MKTKTFTMVLAAETALAAAAEFQAGFGRVDITPPIGTPLAGSFHRRISNGVLEPLEANAVAFSDGTNRAVVLSLDVINLRGYYDLYRQGVAKATGLPVEAIFLACTHTHTGPIVGSAPYGRQFETFETASVYEKSLEGLIASAAQLALGDLAPATLFFARGEAKGISFIRRYRMKDGSCHMNPRAGDPDIVGPLGVPDEEVQLLRIDRKDKPDIALVNFQCHPCTIGGWKISPDWPCVLRATVERCLDDVKCIFVNGAEGDSNHIAIDPDHPTRHLAPGGKTYVHMGRAVAGVAIGLWDVCQPLPAGRVNYGIARARIKANRGTPEQLAKAEEIMKLRRAGRYDDIPGTSLERPAIAAEAGRIVNLKDGPDAFEMPLSAVSIGGSVAFTGFPGEPFTAYGVAMKTRSPFALTIPACIVNGNYGYLPEAKALREGSYEVRGSLFTDELERAMIDGHLGQLERLYMERQ